MLDVRGNCSILRRSCMTQPFVWRGSTRVLRRSFAGSRSSIYIVCVAARPCGSIPSGSDVAQSLCGAGPRGSTRGPRRSGRVSIIESCLRSSRGSHAGTRGPRGLAGERGTRV